MLKQKEVHANIVSLNSHFHFLTIFQINQKAGDTEFFDEIEFNYQVYNKFRSRLFTLRHDKFLIWACANFGYGAWKEIKAEIKREPSFEFDHYIKSRSEGDLNKRMNSLLKVINTELKYDVSYHPAPLKSFY